MSVRNLVSIALAGATLLSGVLAAPSAHADDPLSPIRGTVNGDRSRTGCPAYTYSAALEAAAQAKVRYTSMPAQGTTAAGYNGTSKVFYGWGDPQAQAINKAYQQGVGDLINNCDYTEFGVGFVRNDDIEDDIVGIAFGAPAKVVAPPPVVDPAPPAPVQCLAGSLTPTVPAGQTCVPGPTPTDAIQVSIKKGSTWTVTVTSTAPIRGNCSYAATNPVLASSKNNFGIDAKQTVSFTAKAAPPLFSYHVVVSCSGAFYNKLIEFGHFEKDVPA